jgi:hypothetical protein
MATPANYAYFERHLPFLPWGHCIATGRPAVRERYAARCARACGDSRADDAPRRTFRADSALAGSAVHLKAARREWRRASSLLCGRRLPVPYEKGDGAAVGESRPLSIGLPV